MLKNIKKIAACFIAVSAPYYLLGATPEVGVVTAESGNSIDVMLAIVTVILLLPLYLSTKTFLMVANGFISKKKNESNTINKIGVLLILLCFSQLAFAQTPEVSTAPKAGDIFPENVLTWILVTIILLESILIVLFSYLTNKFMKQPAAKAKQIHGLTPVAPKEDNWMKKMWDKMNSFKPLTEEGHIDTGHSYDGIRELNNITPPWFSTTFILSIIFAAGYLYTHHISKSAPMQEEEFNIEMAEAEKAKTKMLAIQGNNVDENNVTLLVGEDIITGQKLFSEKCVACHAAHGGSAAGGVGPNLTDNYWIHGGSLKDIFKTIKYGWQEKGMISWKDQLTPKQMAQVASFIKSIGGSNPSGAKEPQGELYTEEGATGSSMVKDSIATDSVKKVNKK